MTSSRLQSVTDPLDNSAGVPYEHLAHPADYDRNAAWSDVVVQSTYATTMPCDAYPGGAIMASCARLGFEGVRDDGRSSRTWAAGV